MIFVLDIVCETDVATNDGESGNSQESFKGKRCHVASTKWFPLQCREGKNCDGLMFSPVASNGDDR